MYRYHDDCETFEVNRSVLLNTVMCASDLKVQRCAVQSVCIDCQDRVYGVWWSALHSFHLFVNKSST